MGKPGAGEGSEGELRLEGVQAPNAGRSNRVGAYEARDELVHHCLGAERRAEITTQPVNLLDKVHA